ncbi:hypothetical protein ACQCQF_22375, partial [Ralstonia pseudosolanacearum]
MSASALRFASAWPDAAALADRLIDRHADAFGRAPHAWSVTDRADDAATAAVLLTTDAAQAERARAAGAASSPTTRNTPGSRARRPRPTPVEARP